MIYLDNAARSKPSQEVIKEMTTLLKERWGSPFSPHPFGQLNVPLINRSFERIRKQINGSDRDGLYFASSRPEAINGVIWSTYNEITKEFGKNHYLTTQIEEAPQLFTLTKLEENSCVSKLLPVNEDAILSAETLTEGLSPRTALLTLSLVNPLLGTVQPLDMIGAICKERGVLLHVDLTHALGKMEIDLNGWGVDFATFSGECVGAFPNGACIYVREGVPFTSPIYGIETASLGVIDLPQLAGLATGLEISSQKRGHLLMESARLRDYFETTILSELDNAEVLLKANRLPTTSLIAFKGIASEALLFALADRGLYGSIGGGLFQQISHILESAKVDPYLAKCAISFTLSIDTTEEEIEQAARIVVSSVKKLKELWRSP